MQQDIACGRVCRECFDAELKSVSSSDSRNSVEIEAGRMDIERVGQPVILIDNSCLRINQHFIRNGFDKTGQSDIAPGKDPDITGCRLNNIMHDQGFLRPWR